MSMPSRARNGVMARLRVAAAIWLAYVSVKVAVARWPLPVAVERVGRGLRPLPVPEPKRLGQMVNRALRLGPVRARCLSRSLVLYRLVRSRYPSAELVIGLPEEADGHEAHAWVDIDGIDVGPPPGRDGRQELVRYG